MTVNKLKATAALMVAMGALMASPAHAGKTLDAIKARGQVICGVNTGLAGFSAAEALSHASNDFLLAAAVKDGEFQ